MLGVTFMDWLASVPKVMWITVERILDGAPTSIGAMSGAVAGLATCRCKTT